MKSTYRATVIKPKTKNKYLVQVFKRQKHNSGLYIGCKTIAGKKRAYDFKEGVMSGLIDPEKELKKKKYAEKLPELSVGEVKPLAVRALFSSILFRAVNDLNVESERKSAKIWFEYPDIGRVSLSDCCYAVGLDVGRVQQWAEAIYSGNHDVGDLYKKKIIELHSEQGMPVVTISEHLGLPRDYVDSVITESGAKKLMSSTSFRKALPTMTRGQAVEHCKRKMNAGVEESFYEKNKRA